MCLALTDDGRSRKVLQRHAIYKVLFSMFYEVIKQVYICLNFWLPWPFKSKNTPNKLFSITINLCILNLTLYHRMRMLIVEGHMVGDVYVSCLHLWSLVNNHSIQIFLFVFYQVNKNINILGNSIYYWHYF